MGALGEPPQLVRDITHRGQATPAVGDCPASGPASEPALREAIERILWARSLDLGLLRVSCGLNHRAGHR